MAKGFDDQLDKAMEKVNLISKKKIKNMKEAGVKFKEGEAGFNIPGKDKSTEVSSDIISDSFRDPVPPLLTNKGNMKQRLMETKADLDNIKEKDKREENAEDEEAHNTEHGTKKLNTDKWVGDLLIFLEKTVFYNDPRPNRYKRWQDMSKIARNKDQHMTVYIYEAEADLRKASEVKL